jgi:pterin-4a-carbinolamine dehydratase
VAARIRGFRDVPDPIRGASLIGEARHRQAAGHQPDFCLRDWNEVSLTLTTHASGGLSRNDFVLAAELQSTVRPVEA